MAELKRALFGYNRSSVGAALADRDRMVQRSSRDARSAEERTERLAAEVLETQGRQARAEERLRTAQDLAQKLAEQLEESIGGRAAMEAELATLRNQLENVTTTLASTEYMVSDRDAQLQAAAERTASLEAEHRASLNGALNRVAELEELLADYRAELQERPVARAPAAADEQPPEPEGVASTAEELAAVLLVAEQAVVRIIESTKERADEELRTADEDRERVRHDVESMVAWRDRAAPVIASLQATMDDLSSRVADVASRVGHALEPITSGVLRLTSELAALEEVPRGVRRPGSDESGSGGDARVIELRDEPFAGREAARDT